MNERTRVAVLFGGRSDEHAVSCATAAGVLAAIDRDRYEVVPIGISRRGDWLRVADDPQRWRIATGTEPEVTAEAGPRVVLPMGEQRLVAVDGPDAGKAMMGVDVVLPLLHGPFGEDGTIQGMLELAGLPYVGSGVLASAVGMDKHYMKMILAGAGLPVGAYTVITDRQWRTAAQQAAARVAQLGWPVFVKPCRAGSSIGITKVDRPEDLVGAVEAARVHDPKVIVEAAIEGREVECAVLQGRGDMPPRSTRPGEVAVTSGDHGFYDYEAKYFDSSGVDLHWPADLPAAAEQRVRQLAEATFEALSCEGLARVDFFYTSAAEVIVNEVNTMPGFTPLSMYPMMWERSGLGYRDLITELVELARQRRTGLR